MKNAPIRHRIEHLAYLGVKGALRLLPHGASRAIGRRLGDVFRWVAGSRRRTAEENLAAALPELTEADRRRIARGCFQHLGASFADVLSAHRFDLQDLCERLHFEGAEHYRDALAEGRGVFALSAHLGHWEIAAHALGGFFQPLHVVGRPLDNPHLDRELQELRQRFGNVSLPKRGAARGMVKALKRQAAVGILIDQRVQEHEGIEVPFFGRPSWTSPILARLSLRTGAPVVPVFAYAEPGGRYRLVMRPAIHPEASPEHDDDEAVFALTERYLQATEREIRERPDQWMWMHRRWKQRRKPAPPAEA